MKANIGMCAAELLSEIVSSHYIEQLTFALYRPTLSFKARVEERVKVALTNPLLNQNQRFFEEQKIIVEERLDHDLKVEFDRRHSVKTEVFSLEYLEKTMASLEPDQVIALCSICQMKDGTEVHIPMMDFACEVNSKNLELVKSLIQFIGLKGAILDSGNSYHFYGFDLISGEEWLNLMAKFLLSSPLADARYIAHRILGRTCVLRISPSPQKPKVPTIEAIIN